MEIIFLIGRIMLGGYFVYAAYNHFKNLKGLTAYAASKKVPMAREGVMVTGLVLFIGGATILTGMGVVVGMWLLVVFLLVASFSMHAFWKHPAGMERMSDEINFTKNLALVGALLVIIALVMVPM